MTRRMNVILCIALSFMILFTAVGYATLTTSLYISGTAEVEIPYGLFITNIKVMGSSRVDHYDVSYITHSTTVESLIDKSNSYSYAGSVTYSITVFNNTTREYAYRGLYYQSNLSGYNGNSRVSTSNNGSRIGVVTNFVNDDKVVGPGEHLTFTVTYTVGKDMNYQTDWKTLLNFQFGINVESEAEARDAVHGKFLDILNTSSTYETLYEQLDNKYDGSTNYWKSNYIGNVSNAVDADSMTVETLFAGQLNMIIDGQTKPASVLIKHEDLDNNPNTGDDYSVTRSNGEVVTFRGCEMTLYLTTDQLTNANGWAPVYVTVFTCDRDENGNIISDWYKIGDSYAGEANIVGYNGEAGGTGSFVTDNWKSTWETYSPTEKYSYTVNSGVTIKTLVQTVEQNAINAFQSLLNEAKAMIDDLTYAGTGITIVEDAYYAAAKHYTVDAQGNPIANAGTTRAQIIPFMASLDYALTEAREAIDALPEN